jgi:dipeptidyl aminopeptidase/acylaminoacyl peptidase
MNRCFAAGQLGTFFLGIAAMSFAMPPAGADEPDDPRRPAAIHTESVPVVALELPERLRQYQNVRSAVFEGWAPVGRGMLVQTRFGNTMQLHRVYEPGGRREQITFFDEPAGGRFLPTSDHDVLVTMSRGGDENDQVYLMDLLRFETRLLTDGSSRNTLGPVLRDGSRIIFTSNRRNGSDTDIYLADVGQSAEPEMVLETDREFWTPHDVSTDGRFLALSRYVSINEGYPAILNLSSKQLELLPLPVEGIAGVGDMAFSPDGRSVWITTDATDEFMQLGLFDIGSREYSWPAGRFDWSVSEIEVDPTTGAVAFTINEDGASRLFVYHEGEVRPLTLPLAVVAGLEFSPDGTQLGFSLARPDAPAESTSINVDGSGLTRWTFSETGGLDATTFVTPERIQFTSFDGRTIPAYYYRPRTASVRTPAAVLIDIHGGPESQFRPTFVGQTQFYLNELEIAVIHPNVRGSDGYGKSYLKLDNAELREDSVRDIGALLDWIAQQPELDAGRVAVAGGSYGGYMVLASLVHFGDRLRAGVDQVGIANFVTFLENTAPYRRDLRRAEYGDERDPAIREFFEKINPASNADRIRSALLVAHGVNDPRVPISEARQIADRVRVAGRPVWTVYADNEGHGFAKKENRDFLSAVIAMFLQEHLR